MTIIIIVIAAIAIVSDLISRMSKKGSSESPSSESSGPKLRNPDHVKKAQALVEKAIKMSPEIGVGNIKLYLPPPEHELFKWCRAF
ncbi:hypothetical protein OAT11_02225 [Nitrospinaceae bacterium]|nr:hypothetical protein [Nitrospinaceae bacterium]